MIELRSWLVGFADLKGWFLCLVGCVSLTEVVSNERIQTSGFERAVSNERIQTSGCKRADANERIQTSGANQEEVNRKNVTEKTEQKNFNKKMSMNSLRKDGVWT